MPIILVPQGLTPPGATVPWSDWFNDVLPDCPGLTEAMAEHYIRDAVIEFCKLTWAYQYADTGTTVDQTAAYALAPPAGTTPLGTLYVKAQPTTTDEEREIAEATAKAINLAAASEGAPQYFTLATYDTVTFYPTPDDTYDYTVRLALAPTETAAEVDELLYTRYRVGIAHGAKAALMSMAKKPWTDGSLAQYHWARFTDVVRRAKIEVSTSYTNGDTMVMLGGGSF